MDNDVKTQEIEVHVLA